MRHISLVCGRYGLPWINWIAAQPPNTRKVLTCSAPCTTGPSGLMLDLCRLLVITSSLVLSWFKRRLFLAAHAYIYLPSLFTDYCSAEFELSNMNWGVDNFLHVQMSRPEF